MSEGKSKVVFLSSAQLSLEEDAYNALENNDFELALEKLAPLIENKFRSYSVNTGYIISLINLQKLDDAEDFCQLLLNEIGEDEEDYVDYFDFYMMILYEKGLYLELIGEINRFLDAYEVDPLLEEKFELLLILANEMNHDITHAELEKLKRAVTDGQHSIQWRCIQKLRAYNAVPPDFLVELLQEEQVHPVVKTFILSWLKESGGTKEIEVVKFNQVIKVIPKLFPDWDKHPVYENINGSIADIEQSNPSLYSLIKVLVDAYCYVYYPVIPNRTVEELSEAFIVIASNQLEDKKNSSIENDVILECIEEINLAHRLYLSIIPD